MIKKKIANLLGLRSIITLITTIVLNYGFIVGKIDAKEYMVIAMMIFTFYFSKRDQGGGDING